MRYSEECRAACCGYVRDGYTFGAAATRAAIEAGESDVPTPETVGRWCRFAGVTTRTNGCAPGRKIWPESARELALDLRAIGWTYPLILERLSEVYDRKPPSRQTLWAWLNEGK